MTAVISFMRLSPLSPVNDTASDAASAYYDLAYCSFRASPYGALNQWVARLKGLPCTDMARHAPDGALRECAEAGQILEIEMSFINSSGLDELARRLADSVPESVRAFGRDMEGNFKAVLQAQLSKLNLVSRQEFDVQAAILERTQAKLTAMEARLKEIEAKLSPQ
jgi:ubiquinone biosynthesis accessory factor UbiK